MRILSAIGFTLLIAMAIRWLGIRLVPLLMPRARLKTLGIGWLGGLAGNFVAQALGPGPEVIGVSLWGAIGGAAVAILAMGLFPFLRILAGRL